MLNYDKREWIIKQHKKGMSVSDVCRSQKVSRQTYYNIKKAYEKEGLIALKDKPLGRRIDAIPKATQDKILKLRKQTHGIRKIEGLLKQEGLAVSKRKITKVLQENNLHIFHPKKGRRYKYIRWERKHSNSLWQTDFCWIAKMDCWLTAWLDDHSRLVTSADYVTEATTESAIILFEKGVKKYGLPRQTLSDRGTQYYAVKGETSRFLEYMNSRNVKHIYASVKKPTTCGKLERWWRTHNDERWNFPTLRRFVNHYNNKRFHMSLNWKTPYEVWLTDLKV